MSQVTDNQCAITFSEFLASHESNQQQHVVLGNEAGDADSIISALSLAFVDSLYYNALKTPIVSIPRQDLPLRRETVLLLELAGVNTSKLRYIDDKGVLDGVREITLVDHNRLTLASSTLPDNVNVVEILDHHFDEQEHSHVQGDLRNVAFQDNHALVASTCTLIAERLFASDAAKPPYDFSLSISLLGVILLDTVNMKPEAGKGTARDQSAIDTLVQETDWSTLATSSNEHDLLDTDSGMIDTDKLFHLLSESKFSVDFWKSLSVKDTLRLDYKRFQVVNENAFGASSILLNLDLFLAKDNLIGDILSFMAQVNIPLLAVLSSQFQNNEPRRQLLLCGTDAKLVEQMAMYLLTSHEASMMESEQVPLGITADESLAMKRFRQGNPKASRKQVAPILSSFYSSESSTYSS